MKVKIPFKEDFKELLLKGGKTATSRTKQYGQQGDTFAAFGAEFEITAVERHPLRVVKWHFYKQEGFYSPEGFGKVWDLIHPRRGYAPDLLVWVHFFKRVDTYKETE